MATLESKMLSLGDYQTALSGASLTQVTPVDTDQVLILDASDGNNLKYALKSSIAGLGGATIANTPPSFEEGKLWWHSELGMMFVGFEDSDNTQTFVEASPATQPQNLTQSNFDVTASLNIYNSAGTLLKTIYGPAT